MSNNLPPGVTDQMIEDQIGPEFYADDEVRIADDAFRFEDGDPTFAAARGKLGVVMEVTANDGGWVYVRLHGTRIVIGCYTNEIEKLDVFAPDSPVAASDTLAGIEHSDGTVNRPGAMRDDDHTYEGDE